VAISVYTCQSDAWQRSHLKCLQMFFTACKTRLRTAGRHDKQHAVQNQAAYWGETCAASTGIQQPLTAATCQQDVLLSACCEVSCQYIQAVHCMGTYANPRSMHVRWLCQVALLQRIRSLTNGNI
jgi:hypothetical protein